MPKLTNRVPLLAVLGLGLALNTVWICGGALVAVAVVAGLALSLGEALLVVTGVWLATQIDGFALLRYPHDAATIGWGVALGCAAAFATVTASCVRARVPASSSLARAARAALAAASSFVSYEIFLFAYGRVVGNVAGFTPAIVAEIARTNGLGMLALYTGCAIVVRTVERSRSASA